jgi:hypothetical protein
MMFMKAGMNPDRPRCPMAVPTTPVRKYPILARHRSTRKDQRLSGVISGEMGVPGKEGTHYYNITLAPAGNGKEKLTCDCPAFRYGRSTQVQRTGLCKHMQAVLETLTVSPTVTRTENGDILVYAGDVLAQMLRAARR